MVTSVAYVSSQKTIKSITNVALYFQSDLLRGVVFLEGRWIGVGCITVAATGVFAVKAKSSNEWPNT